MQYFVQALDEQPVLYMILIFHLYGVTVDIPFIYSDWDYGDDGNQLKRNLKEVIRQRTCILLEAIFRGMFNIRPEMEVSVERKWRCWVG